MSINETFSHMQVMQAFIDGKEIEVYDNYTIGASWKPCANPSWNWYAYSFRVKPTIKDVPYSTPKDVALDMRDHGPMVMTDGVYYTIIRIAENSIILNGIGEVNYEAFQYMFTWQDGHKCCRTKESE